MLPGLVLTVGVFAQSIATLIPATAPNPHARRFVNIGDTIIESSTAMPVAPAAGCEPIEPTARVEPQAGDGPAVSVDESEVTETPRVETRAEGLPFVALAVSSFSPHQRPRPPAVHPQRTNGSISTVLLPPFPTVVLPRPSPLPGTGR